MSKLLTYTIGGQKIGIDIKSWNAAMLSGNTAFITIPNTGSTPTNYTDISSIIYWGQFGNAAGLTDAQVKQELTNLITLTPTPEEVIVLQEWGIYVDTSFISGQTGTFWGDFRVEGKLWVETIRRVKQEANISYVRVDQSLPVTGVNGIAGLAILNPTGATTGYTSLDKIPVYYLGVNRDGVLVAGWSGNTQPIGGSAVWGGITGTLSSQTDLQNALNAKLTTTTFNTYSANTLTNINTRVLNTTFNTYTGTTAPARYALKTAAITGATNIGNGSGLGLYTSVSANKLQLKSLNAGTNVTLASTATGITISAAATAAAIVYSGVTSNGNTTTTSTTDVLMTGMQILNVPTGTYLVSHGTSLSHSTASATITTSIYVGGSLVTNSELTWQRGGSQAAVISNHGYSNFVITLASPATVQIRWRTPSATATSNTNRYLTLLRVK
jgi:hypothetical protein